MRTDPPADAGATTSTNRPGADPSNDRPGPDPFNDRPGADPSTNRPGADVGAPGRDRDAAGRPRNARPRDALGRPLPYGVPGVPTTDESVVLTAAQALVEAQRLLDEGAPFHAHEVLEGAWKAAPAEEREMWRGLAQLAVGLTHARRGNTAGASRLLQRAADRIETYGHDAPHGVPVQALARWARSTADRMGTAGTPALTSADLTPRLLAG